MSATTDLEQFSTLAQSLLEWVESFQADLDQRPVGAQGELKISQRALPKRGEGFTAAFEAFKASIAPNLSGSVGPRYLGFVTGGATPASIMADWLVSAIDQNVSTSGDSIATEVELQALDWLREMFVLPETFEGVLTTGATSANILGALTGRQFAGLQQGIDVARDGLAGAEIEVFSATPHASMKKAMAIAGLGRDQITPVDNLPDSEAMDVADLARKLDDSSVPGKIVIASAGTVTGTDFDDLAAIALLCKKHNAWLHVDGAFGLFTRMLPEQRHLTEGIQFADSITSDCHKWLNVPYDSGVFFTRHVELLNQVCSVAAPYLDTGLDSVDFMDRGIENSRRFRALPIWMALKAYGVDGHRQIVEQNCASAQQLADWIEASGDYRLLHPCTMNVVIFQPVHHDAKTVLGRINRSGAVFMTPGFWFGKSGLRAAFSNWKTGPKDVALVCEALAQAVKQSDQ